MLLCYGIAGLEDEKRMRVGNSSFCCGMNDYPAFWVIFFISHFTWISGSTQIAVDGVVWIWCVEMMGLHFMRSLLFAVLVWVCG